MITRTCDGCGRVVLDDDTHAVRNVACGGENGRPLDWCGECVAIIRAELPKLAARAREARRDAAALPVRQRALSVMIPRRVPR